MKRKIIIIIGGIITTGWGISHLFPTMNVVNSFGAISADNRNIITMEWINEGLTLIFIGVLAVVAALSDRGNGIVSRRIYLVTGMMLVVMAIVSLFTGFNVDFPPYKLCPFIFCVSAVMIGQGAYPGKRG